MGKLIDFSEALEQSGEKGKKNLLLGNGFSVKYFNYNNLLEECELDAKTRRLFDNLQTVDFEQVVKALDDAALVAAAFGHNDVSEEYHDQADIVRSALVDTIRATHPENKFEIEDEIPTCAEFLSKFSKIFTLNYDLLLYWVRLVGKLNFSDGFGKGKEFMGYRGPFREDAYCCVYNLHGGLHLFPTTDGQLEKRIAGDDGIVAALNHSVAVQKRMPLYVAEGTSSAKMAKINSDAYLRHCYEQLSKVSGSVFVFGHSANQNDEHIYKALFGSEMEMMYFCVYTPDADIDAISGELDRYKRKYGRKDKYYRLVDAQTANVWP